jgi:hypothetical protein
MAGRRKKTRDRSGQWGPWSFTHETINPVTGVHRRLPEHCVLAVNGRYQVSRTEMDGGWVHLSIKRLDRRPIRDWRAFQRIKNELVGPEREAVELYPAERRLHDAANQYHLWVAPPGMEWPVGFEGRSVSSDAHRYPGAVQRPLPAGTPETAVHLHVLIRQPDHRPDPCPSDLDDPREAR